MPTYDYECQSCQHAFEKFQGISDPVMRKCPRCEKRSLKRLIGSGAGIIFKGSGFYCTDYKNTAHQQSKQNEKQTSSEKKDAPAPTGGAGDSSNNSND